MQMIEAEAREWVEALESGKYSQVRAVLHDNSGFCCLGVKCDLDKDRLKLRVKIRETDEQKARYYDGSLSILPHSMCHRYNCESTGLHLAYDELPPEYKDKIEEARRKAGHKSDRSGSRIALAHLNDYGLTFKEIAGLIRQHIVIIDDYDKRNVIRKGL